MTFDLTSVEFKCVTLPKDHSRGLAEWGQEEEQENK